MKRVLVTPLDWGLGHATRSLSIIRELERAECEVLIAGNGDSLELLKAELPHHNFFTLPGYDPVYPLNGSMVMTMARQLPRFVRVIKDEHRATESIVVKAKIDLIISDNRYGCWSEKAPSVLVTHQSNVLMPKRFGWLQIPVRKTTEHMMNRFTRCWVPDMPSPDSLTGELISFGAFRTNVPVEFIGWLSRFERRESTPDILYDVLAICSGPEPQRSILERMLYSQLSSSGLSFRIVRGLPSKDIQGDSRVVNMMTSSELQEAIESAALVIARSGYSTVMDMLALGKRAIFVPTPGQTEQEYLANVLMSKGIAYSMPQDAFDLSHALEKSKQYKGFTPQEKGDLLRQAVLRVLTNA